VPTWAARRGRFELLGINPFKNAIKLSLGSHFNMGGLHCDEHGQTTVPGLLAAGEVAGALHGGLRVSGFSFSQMIVFGLETGRHAAELARATATPAMHDPAIENQEQKRLYQFLEAKTNGLTVHAVQKQLHEIMQRDVFLVRTEEGLTRAREAIRSVRDELLPRVQVAGSKRFNLDWGRAIELGYTLDVSAAVVESALARRESRGFHWRDDYPKAAEALPRHTVAYWRDGGVDVSMFPVNMCRRLPEVTA
jgi:succinate dehydrogenase/fumarate reductase flavoprotein subunit